MLSWAVRRQYLSASAVRSIPPATAGAPVQPAQRGRLDNFMSRGAADQGGACFGVAVYLPQRLAPELAGSLDLRPGTIPDSADLLKIYQVSQGF